MAATDRQAKPFEDLPRCVLDQKAIVWPGQSVRHSDSQAAKQSSKLMQRINCLFAYLEKLPRQNCIYQSELTAPPAYTEVASLISYTINHSMQRVLGDARFIMKPNSIVSATENKL